MYYSLTKTQRIGYFAFSIFIDYQVTTLAFKVF
jgi:hypothetical protein